MAFDLSTYKRIIKVLSADRLSTVATLCDLSTSTNVVVNAEFTLLRLGGCGQGSVTLAKGFDYSTIELGMWITMGYTTTPWYIGRVESIDYNHPSGVQVHLQGPLFALLSDFPVGGSGNYDLTGAEVVAAANYYYHDPNIADQTLTTVSDYRDVLDWLYDNYLDPLGIGVGTITDPATPISFYSMTFSGESSVAEVLRVLAESVYNASYGIDANFNLFFIPVSEGVTDLDGYPSTPQVTYQIGTDLVEGTTANSGRSVFYNRVQLVGGLVYGDLASSSGVYRYTAYGYDDTHAATWGYKTAIISVPFIRNDWAAFQWMDNFFKKYGGPRTRYTFTTIAQGSTLITPWGGSVKLNNQAASELTTDLFDELHVSLNEAPYYTITTGPEDLQYPEADVQDATEPGSQGSTSSGDNRNLPPYPPLLEHPPPLPPFYEGPCEEEHTFTVTGTVTAGSLVLTYTIGGTTTDITLAYDATGWLIEQEFIDNHAGVSIDDILVTGSVVDGFTIKFRNRLANTEIDLPDIDFSGLTGATDVTAAKTTSCPTPCCDISPTTTGSCPCVVVTGIIDPIESPPFGAKAAYRFKSPDVVAALNANGFTVATTDLIMTYVVANARWESDTIVRTCSSSITDDYVAILEQIAPSGSDPGGWRWSFGLVSGSPNCADEIDWVMRSY